VSALGGENACRLEEIISKFRGIIQDETEKRELLKKPPRNWRNPRKKFIDRNWTIKTCLL